MKVRSSLIPLQFAPLFFYSYRVGATHAGEIHHKITRAKNCAPRMYTRAEAANWKQRRTREAIALYVDDKKAQGRLRERTEKKGGAHLVVRVWGLDARKSPV